jgi:ribonuclease-3
MSQKPDEILAIAGELLGYEFKDEELLITAVTHKSFANEASPADRVEHNERLEFLGDAVLSLSVSELLMTSHPDVEEGELSKMRAFLVNEQQLSQTGRQFKLGQLLRLGKGEYKSGGQDKPSILADLYEAILGAIYLDGGLQAASDFVRRTLGSLIDAVLLSAVAFDPKSRLQEVFQQNKRMPPRYGLVDIEGPDHDRKFTVAIYDRDRELCRGTGTSKKDAEQDSARILLQMIAENQISIFEQEATANDK